VPLQPHSWLFAVLKKIAPAVPEKHAVVVAGEVVTKLPLTWNAVVLAATLDVAALLKPLI